jgi:NAD+ diphosphatase
MDDEEMSDVRWFSREEVLLALEGRSDELTVPGPIAIAHHLLKAWATGDIGPR